MTTDEFNQIVKDWIPSGAHFLTHRHRYMLQDGETLLAISRYKKAGDAQRLPISMYRRSR